MAALPSDLLKAIKGQREPLDTSSVIVDRQWRKGFRNGRQSNTLRLFAVLCIYGGFPFCNE